MGLRYIVVTSVTRDDLPDGGASQFAKTIEAIKARIAGAKVEVLVPDFGGSTESIETVLKAEPLVLNHNVETAPRLYPQVRPQARFERSLQLLETSKVLRPSVYTKSGLMVGLGESKDEVVEVLHALRRAQCDIVTIGQYLPPSRRHLPVVEYVHPSRFAEYKAIGESIGFRYVASGPFIRSSYHASEFSPENSS